MKRHSEKGMALVITLMMLAIVTFMAVVFLSLSRRERGNVKISEDQATARSMADAALERSKADLTAGMANALENYLALTDPRFGPTNAQKHIAIANRAVQNALLSYDLRASKNFFNPAGFRKTDGSSPWNVGYYDFLGNVYNDRDKQLSTTSDDYYQHIANLQYDPRPPVIVTEGKTNENRFYIDLNRNGMFDPNAVLDVTGPNNERYNANTLKISSSAPYFAGRFSGDPEWIGVLERPDLPHSETNRFIGRYAYIILPTGKSLDINFIHNLAAFDAANPALKYSAGPTPRFSRNQGVGSWELNLAAFLVDLHTNVWKPGSTTFYRMTTNVASGVAFKDAVGLLQYRYNNSNSNLFTPQQVFGAPAINRWNRDYVDMDGDGPIIPYSLWYASARPNFDLESRGVTADNDTDAKFWYGAEHAERTGEFPDVQRYFKLKTPAASSEQLDFYQNFTNAVSSTRTNTYDRYAYYRLLAQMGADSKPAINGKIHLNFANEPGIITTNLISWVTNGALPTLVVRSNTAVLAEQKDGGLAYTNAAGNNLTNFFLMAADAMLKASLVTNVYLDVVAVSPRAYGWRTNYTIGGTYFHDPSLNAVPDDPRRPRYIVNTPVRPDISITNIQIYHAPFATNQWRPIQNTYTNNEYNASLHRILQLAANIYDSMTNNAGRTGNPIASARDKADSPADPYFPSVFRPIYGMTTTNILIVGWEPQETANFAMQAVSDITRFRSPAQYFTNANGVNITNVSFYGQPWVVGVKKGWPNFNEFSIETFAQVTRKLEVLKDAGKEKQKVDTNTLQTLADHTREIYLVGFSNTFGVEAWNSYMRTNRRELQLITEVRAEFGVDRVTKRDTNGNVLQSFNVPLNLTNPVIQMVKSMTSRDWPGRKGDNELTNSSPNPANGATITGGTDFRIPIYQTIGILTNTQYADTPVPHFFRTPPTFQALTETPDLRVNVTNRLRYLMVDVQENRVIDYVTLDNLVTSFDLTRTIRGEQGTGSIFGAGIDPGMFWDTNSVAKGPTANGLTLGIMNQINASLGLIALSDKDWKDYSGTVPQNIEKEIRDFVDYMNGVPTNATVQTNITRQVPFSPTRHFYMNAAYQANDPLVHYTLEDLKNPMMDLRPTPFVIPPKNKELGKRNKARQAIRVDGKHGVEFQDPRIFESDDWQFPIAKLDDPTVRPNQITPYGIPKFNYRFPNIGTLGQIHRGTPWQTVYLKAFAATNTVPGYQFGAVPLWSQWAGYYGSHPTNDWKLVGLFTTAMTENAARGLLGVNQSHTAAWSAVMSGIPVITNSLSNSKASKGLGPQFGVPGSGADLMIEPGSVQLSNIVRSINAYRTTRPIGVFSYLGEILGSPKLSVGVNPFTGAFEGSPYLNLNASQTLAPAEQQLSWNQFTDEAIEAIPQRILSLIKEDEPRVTIYCFGQTLKPAPRSYVTSADFYNLCVNYQVTGEYVTKAVVRVEGEMDPRDIAIEQDKNITDAQRAAWKEQRVPLKTVVESFEVLPPFE
jgi:hypothetical protein